MGLLQQRQKCTPNLNPELVRQGSEARCALHTQTCQHQAEHRPGRPRGRQCCRVPQGKRPGLAVSYLVTVFDLPGLPCTAAGRKTDRHLHTKGSHCCGLGLRRHCQPWQETSFSTRNDLAAASGAGAPTGQRMAGSERPSSPTKARDLAGDPRLSASAVRCPRAGRWSRTCNYIFQQSRETSKKNQVKLTVLYFI